MAKSWHAARMGNDHQGLVIDSSTGANIAVTYDKAHAPLVAAAPDLLAALERLLRSPMLIGNSREAGEAYRDCQAAIAAAQAE